MRVLLLEPSSNTAPWEYSISSRENLGLGYLAAAARMAGHIVEVVSCPSHGWDYDQMAAAVQEFQPELVGISFPFTDELAGALQSTQLLAEALNPNVPLLAGGHAAAASGAGILEALPSVKALIRGEGELTFMDALGAIAEQRDLGSVPGLAFRRSGVVYKTPNRELITDLDKLPFPNRDTLRRKKATGAEPTEVYLTGSRGCQYRCSFCSVKTFYANGNGHSWRGRLPASIAAELKMLSREFGAQPTYCFVDDQFIGPGRNGQLRARAIAEAILNEGLHLSLEITCRADTLERETLMMLKRAGLQGVYIGLDSGSQAALDRFQKDISIEQNLDAVKLLLDLGIPIDFGFIMFDPWMTIQDLQSNLMFLQRLLDLGIPIHASTLLNGLRLYPMTPIAERASGRPDTRALEPVREMQNELTAMCAAGGSVIAGGASRDLLGAMLARLEDVATRDLATTSFVSIDMLSMEVAR